MSTPSGTPAPRHALAGQAETGRACPYCRFPLKEGVEIAQCGVCKAPHHSDCWQDNHGCAVIACAGGPASAQAGGQAPRTGTAPTQVLMGNQANRPPSPPPPVPPGQWQTAGSSGGGWKGPSLAVAVLVLALAVGGAAVAIVLSSKGNGTVRLDANAGHVTNQGETNQPVSQPVEDTASTPPESSTGETPPGSSSETPQSANGLLPASSSEQMQGEIQHLLLEWHEDVVAGNYRGAWDLMSERKQQQSSVKYGYSGWVKNQSTLRPYLDPAGLQVSVLSSDPKTGVATVNVTGMTWNKPGSSCGEWSGITWVKYEADTWRYDPGYSTTPQRERKWKSRFPELLGGRC